MKRRAVSLRQLSFLSIVLAALLLSQYVVWFLMFVYYGRPLSVSGRPCYILPMFIYLFIFLWPPYSPALVNGASRKFYMW